jgi:hypothetical protein
LLATALRDSFGEVEDELRRAGVSVSLHKYHEQVKKQLKPVGGEMEKLTERLAQSKRTGKLSNKEVVEVDERARFEIQEIGFRDQPEGLRLQPTGDGFDLDLHDLPEGSTVRGEWYPYEVSVGDFVFILDDDGSLYVSVENFPASLVEQAREQLRELVRRIIGAHL